MLYRNKFIISIYDEDDQLVTVLDNARDFAHMFEKTLDQAYSILSRLFLKKRNSFIYRSRKYYISFIEN